MSFQQNPILEIRHSEPVKESALTDSRHLNKILF